MADKAISDLTQATQLGDNDLFVLEQNGTAKKMLMALWKDYISRNVVSASATQLPAGSQPTATFNPANGALSLGIPKGDKGEPGESSAGYVSGIVKGDGAGGVSAATPNVDYTEPWISTKSYAAGAYCVHNGYLWHNTSGAASTGVEPGTNYNVWNVTYSNENLLDNPWFTVNQRGQSEYGSAIYGFDRWRGRNSSSFISAHSAGGVELSARGGQCYIAQYASADFLNGLRGKTVTLSVRLGDISGGTFAAWVNNRAGDAFLDTHTTQGNKIVSATGVFPDEEHVTSARLVDLIMSSAGNSAVVEAVKLELGSVSTLANDAPPDYATELLKCKRFYQECTAPFMFNASPQETHYLSYFSLPVALRASPVISLKEVDGHYGDITFERWLDASDIANFEIIAVGLNYTIRVATINQSFAGKYGTFGRVCISADL